MPEISRFFGIRITMYWNDHSPPHFHAYYGEYEAFFDIKKGKKIEGKFPNAGTKIIEEWARQHREELLECWELVINKKTPKKIKGADK